MRSFKINDVLSESWTKLEGVKWPIWAILLIAILTIGIAKAILTGMGIKFYGQPLPLIWSNLIIPLASDIIIGFFVCGFVMPAIKKLRNQPFSATTGFEYFKRAPQAMTFMLIVGGINAILLYLSEMLNKNIGISPVHLSWLQAIPVVVSILIMTFCYISVPLMADKNQTVFQAIGQSVRLVGRQWYKILGILMIVYVVMIVAVIPLVVALALKNLIILLLGAVIMVAALIWLLPYTIMLQACVYLKLTQNENR